MTTLSDVRERCASYGPFDAEWCEKMVHNVPDAPEVDRTEWFVERCREKNIISLGCTGKMQDAIDDVTKLVYGVDIVDCDRPLFVRGDLNYAHAIELPLLDAAMPELIVAGEILEHLWNPGGLLIWCLKFRLPLIVSVPNAFFPHERWLSRNQECVNREHVAWYSYYTLMNLLRQTGWRVTECGWYNGKPLVAEGIVAAAIPEE